MSDLDFVAARWQMAVSLGFHILFAVAGIAMPALMVVAEGRWLRYRDPVDLELARRWASGTAILFAVGAVSGTVLSFELGLLWPRFMALAGPVFGLPFALEGFAFFLEAIFLGIFLYGWERVPPRVHWLSGLVIAVSGALSGVFVVTANAWMNSPAGFRLVNGVPVDIDPVRAMLNPAALSQTLHMTIAAYAAVGWAVAAIHALALLRMPQSAFHRRAYAIALAFAAVASILQLPSGDLSARFVAKWQPVKLAAMEGQFETERGAPLRIGGLPDVERRETRWAVEIPRLLSVLAFGDPDAEVRGLEEFPRAHWPPVPVVHVAFQIMVACGTAMAAVAALAGVLASRRRGPPLDRWFLRLVACCAPLGLIAIEAGWTVTEVGRQPWILQGVMLTRDALTPVRGLIVPFVTITLLYLFLGLIVIALLQSQVFRSLRAPEAGGPPEAN
jgi:cytochrome bd ubiquinol oxidase subunit I